MQPANPPPLYTLLTELVSWTLERTVDIPKRHRFTFGQRIENLSLDALLLCVNALFAHRSRKPALLSELNLRFEELRVLWRLVQQQGWISQQQLIFIIGRIDEAGRMTGGWLRQMEGRPEKGGP